MRIPNVSERMKEAPAQALRAMFAGIGQALLVSDRMRRRLKGEHAPEPVSHAAKVPVTKPATAKKASDVPVARPAAEAAEAKPATEAPATKTPAAKPAAPAAKTPAADQAAPTTKTPPAKPASDARATKTPAAKPAAPAAKPAAKAAAPKPTEKPAARPAGAGRPPIPDYDKLSIPSLRARLRGLDMVQVQRLLDYEKAHARRSDVVTMYERRLKRLVDEARG